MLVAGAGSSLLRNEAFGSEPTADDPGNPDGNRVEPFTAGTLLRVNFAHDNADDGIEVLATSARLRDNRAEGNGDFGIDAVAGFVDLGGNTAAGNGNAAQCGSVFCE